MAPNWGPRIQASKTYKDHLIQTTTAAFSGPPFSDINTSFLCGVLEVLVHQLVFMLSFKWLDALYLLPFSLDILIELLLL